MGKFKPNSEFMAALTSMGVENCIAKQALFKTGNKSLDAAIDYIFNNYYSQLEDRDEYDTSRRCKMAFVVNLALCMTMGQSAIQVAEASLNIYKKVALSELDQEEILEMWEEQGERKVILKAINHVHLKDLESACTDLGLSTYMTRTKGPRPIPSVLAIFGYDEAVDEVICDLVRLP